MPRRPRLDAPAFPQVSLEGFNILSGSVFQRFFRQEIGKIFCPIHVELGTIGSNPVFLHARTVGFPKTTALFGGIAGIHDFHHKTIFNFNGLGKTHASNDRRNYLIII